MTPDEPPHYRAFLSYAHSDKAAADWLFHAMESFQIGKDLAGRVTERGPVPDRLYPVFKDRNEFPVGGDLTEETLKALRASVALIVLCSPRSAGSDNVRREIAMFRDLFGDSRPIIPLILGGEHGQTVKDWFPPPLTPDRLAADWREDVGDGRDLALAKVVAALLGLPPEQVYRRVERERRRVFWRWVKVAALIVLLAMGAGAAAWVALVKHDQVETQGRSLEELRALALNYLRATNPAAAADARSVDDLMATLRRIDQEAAAGDRRKAEVLNRIAAGDSAGALELQETIAKDAEAAVERDRARVAEAAKKAAEEYRIAAALAGFGDPKRARDAYASALRLDPEDVGSWMQIGYLQWSARSLTEAEASYQRALMLGRPGQHDRDLYWSRLGLGDILHEQGNLSGAMGQYLDGRAVADRLLAANPNDPRWQRDLSVALNKIGDVLVAQGKGADALSAYRNSLAIRENLTRMDPANIERQRDLLVSFGRVGDALMKQGKVEDALAAYRGSLAIVEHLVRTDPANKGWQRDLSISLNRVARALMAQGKGEEALAAYREDLAIAEDLVREDPGNAGWQEDLAISFNNVGDVLRALGKGEEAIATYRHSMVIIERLVQSNPGNATWQFSLGINHERIGNVLFDQGHSDEALRSYRARHEIIDRLVRADMGNAEWQRDLAVSQFKLGVVVLRLGDVAEARRQLTAGRAIVATLAARSPDWAGVRQDVETFDRVLEMIPP